MKIIFVQTSPSQMDDIFYRGLSDALPDEISIITWNDYGLKRTLVDPELGVVPQFPEISGYNRVWLDRKLHNIRSVYKFIIKSRVKYVVLQDQAWKEKIILSCLLRASGVKVGFRSDKNYLSNGSQSALKHKVERTFLKFLFDFLVPISRLTMLYYKWPKDKLCISLPYCTNKEKFENHDHVIMGQLLRQKLGIPLSCKTFLTVLKFSERENPRLVLEAFKVFQDGNSEAYLVMVGAGPLLEQEKKWVELNKLRNIIFCGYVPYNILENYFFAADVFIHLPKVGPWEISVPDALLAGLGVIATDTVGSAILVMEDSLSKHFIVKCGDVIGVASRMSELCSIEDTATIFKDARYIVSRYLCATPVIAEWKHFIENN